MANEATALTACCWGTLKKESVLNFNGSIAHLALGEIEAELLIDEEGPTKEKKETARFITNAEDFIVAGAILSNAITAK